MNENTNENHTSAAKKAAQLSNDALVITALVIGTVGIAKLAYDTTKLGSEKFKNWKNTKKQK